MRVGVALQVATAALMGAVVAAWELTAQAVPALLLIGLWLVAARPRRVVALTLSLAAFGTSLWAIETQRHATLPEGLVGVDLAVQARVESVQASDGAMRLLLAVNACQAPVSLPSCERLTRVRVSAYDPIAAAPGEQWALTLRLRPPHGFANPGAFDYARWLWRESIQATGYVRASPAPVRLDAARATPRQWALEWLMDRPIDDTTRRWLAALTLGESAALDQQDWALLNSSGTTHLAVISGLHVGLVTSLALVLLRTLARVINPRNWRLRLWPWVGAGGVAIGYAALAGMGPPAMRAMVMSLVALWVLSGRHAPGAWQAWWLALALVVVFDPLALWRPGLWLSFLAVAWLIVIWQGRARPSGWRGWCWALVRSQCLLAPIMAAAVLLAFGRVAPAAPLINLVAVPYVSSIMVPLALLGWLLAPVPLVGEGIWWLFGEALSLFMWALEVTVAQWPLWEPAPWLTYPLACALVLLALAWGLPGVPGWLRLAPVVLLAVSPLWREAPSGPKTLQVAVHDIGQGQLVELRLDDYRLLYDTGPRFRSGFMPLSTLWPPGQHFDRVIVSHADIDHAGGIAALVEAHQVAAWSAPENEPLAVEFEACRRGDSWRVGAAEFRFLWPGPGHEALSANDRSCVLLVQFGEHRILITGDVGRDIERRFLLDVDAPVNLLVAGHHGSATSSGVQFVRTLAPEHVVFSAGRYNAFGHPVDSVVRRFRRQGSCLWSTAYEGAVRFRYRMSEPVAISSQRPVAGLDRCRPPPP